MIHERTPLDSAPLVRESAPRTGGGGETAPPAACDGAAARPWEVAGDWPPGSAALLDLRRGDGMLRENLAVLALALTIGIAGESLLGPDAAPGNALRLGESGRHVRLSGPRRDPFRRRLAEVLRATRRGEEALLEALIGVARAAEARGRQHGAGAALRTAHRLASASGRGEQAARAAAGLAVLAGRAGDSEAELIWSLASCPSGRR